MADPRPTPPPRRPWRWLVGAVVVLFLIVLTLALWSEREDAQRLPADDVERRGEGTWTPEPVDSPAAVSP